MRKDKNVIAVNYNAVCDLERIEKFKQIFTGIS